MSEVESLVHTSSQSPSLQSCLESSSWRRLLAIMETLSLSASTRQKKKALVLQLSQYLQDLQTLLGIVAHFTTEDQRALQALIEANGSLPAQPFITRFGSIRAHRPWQEADNVKKPWLNPLSSTERLLYHGLIYQFRPKSNSNAPLHIVIPNELLGTLRAYFAEQSQGEQNLIALPRPSASGDLLSHLGVWLASLLQQPVSIRHRYWLPPNLLAQLIQRIGLEVKLPCRSERHVPYLAFLHILAESTDFIAHDKTIQLTPAAWQWMAKPSTERVSDLWDTLMPNKSDSPEFSSRIQQPWESIRTKARQLIYAHFQRLLIGQIVQLDEWLVQLRLQDQWQLLPGIQVGNSEEVDEKVDEEGNPWATIDPVKEFCIGPLFWLGVIDLLRDESANKLYLTLTALGAWLLKIPNSQKPAEANDSAIQVAPNTQDLLIAPLDVRPTYLCRIMPYCDWLGAANIAPDKSDHDHRPKSNQHQLYLMPERIKLAAAAGLSATEIMQDLATALGQPTSRRMGQRIRTWAKEGQRVRIQTQTIVETENAQLMAQLRRKKLIRSRLGPPISPNRATVNPDDIPALIQTLSTFDIHVANPFDNQANNSPSPSQQEAEAGSGLPKQTQWMLLQLYRALGQHVDLAAKIPWEIEKSIEAQLSPKQRMSAAETARVIAKEIESALNGYLRIPSWKMPVLIENDEKEENPQEGEGVRDPKKQTKTTIKRMIQQTIATNQPVCIHYWSANHDQPLQRTVTPYYIEERNHIEYLIAYCHLRDEERTFRIDRISQAELSDGRPATTD